MCSRKKKNSIIPYCISVAFTIVSLPSMGVEQNQALTNNNDNVIAIVNNKPVTKMAYHVLSYARKLPTPKQDIDQQKNEPLDEAQKRLIDDLIIAELLAQEAKKRGVDKMPSTLAEAEVQYNTLLGRLLIKEEIDSMDISEDEIHQRYEAIPTQYQYASSQIKLATETDAVETLTKLKEGADFDVLADEYSIGKHTKQGWLMTNQMDPSAVSALKGLNINEYADQPIKTRSGWHIIRLDDKRALDKVTYSRARSWIIQEIKQIRVQQMIAQLRHKATVEILIP